MYWTDRADRPTSPGPLPGDDRADLLVAGGVTLLDSPGIGIGLGS
ncbi:hypothetical protein [Saccharopolyspora hattusasensis]